MTFVYRIHNWDDNFESSGSRKTDRPQWVSVPNKQHGMGLTKILSQPDGRAIYGIWCLIVGACSTQERPREGWLTSDGTAAGVPWTADDLAEKWRSSPSEVGRALEVLTSHKVGWVQRLDATGHELGESASSTPLSCLVKASLVGGGMGIPPAPPVVTEGERTSENRKQLRIALCRKRMAADDQALEEWIGFFQDCRCGSISEIRDCIAWLKAEGSRRGVNGRWAREFEGLAAVWRERQRRAIQDDTKESA